MIFTPDRRYDPIASKESTQRRVSFFVIFIVAAVIAVICWKGTMEDIKNLYNTLLPFFGLVLGFWIGSSKGAADNREQLNKLLGPPGATIIPAPATITATTEGEPNAAKP